MRNQAEQQINLLLNGRASASSDYYTYRYLATEGFLPGYNFRAYHCKPSFPPLAMARARKSICREHVSWHL